MDNFDLKKFLKESKALENLNPIVAKGNLSEGDLRGKIREYILAELSKNDYDFEEEDIYGDYIDDESSYFSHLKDLEDEELENPLMDKFDYEGGDGIEEAKKDEEEDVEDVEIESEETEETPTDNMGGGLEDIASDIEGTEGEIMNHLMSALKIAKGMNNEKLETQIGNTLKFFVSEYIGGGEE
jgi:hypothetical protein